MVKNIRISKSTRRSIVEAKVSNTDIIIDKEIIKRKSITTRETTGTEKDRETDKGTGSVREIETETSKEIETEEIRENTQKSPKKTGMKSCFPLKFPCLKFQTKWSCLLFQLAKKEKGNVLALLWATIDVIRIIMMVNFGILFRGSLV